MVEPRLTATDAAAQIVGLINSRPHSPWVGEIQAIVERVGPTAYDADSTVLAVKLRALMQPLRQAIMDQCEMQLDSPAYREASTRCDDLQSRFDELCHQLWDTPPTTLGDLLLRAEVAQFAARDWPSPYQHWPLASDASIRDGQGSFELRQLAVAVLQMGGRRYAV